MILTLIPLVVTLQEKEYYEYMTGFVGNIEKLTQSNINFRHVIYTGQYHQLVLMCLQPLEEIGLETHEGIDQFFRIEQGEGKVVIGDESHTIKDGDAISVPAGAQHNVINTSSEHPLKLYTIYSPPHHKDGIIHQTKSQAELDTTDHL